jgi:hypothetical protein
MEHKDYFHMQDKQNTDSMSQNWVGLQHVDKLYVHGEALQDCYTSNFMVNCDHKRPEQCNTNVSSIPCNSSHFD